MLDLNIPQDRDFLDRVRDIIMDPEFSEKEESLVRSSSKFAALEPNIRKAALTLFYLNEKDVINDLWHLFYVRPIPTIKEFMTPEYMGPIANNVYDKWKEVASEVFDIDSRIYEVIIGGGIGIGKTTVGIQLLQFYNLYRMTSLRYPQLAHQDVAANTMMVLMLFSLTLSKASLALKKPMLDMLEVSPKFKLIGKKDNLYLDYGPEVVPYKEVDDLILFPRNISVMTGAKIDHALSFSLFGAVMDEAEFRKGSIDKAFEIYSNLQKRVTSRFLGSRFTLLTLISSARYATGVISEYTKSLKKDDPERRYYAFPIWEIKFRDSIKDGWFHVMRGTLSHPSRVLDKEEGTMFDNGSFEVPPNCEIFKVPLRFYKDFTNNLEEALRDLAGIQTLSNEQPFDDLRDIEDINLLKEMNIIAPLPKSKEDVPTPLIKKLPQDFFQRTPNGPVLARYPNALRYCFTGDTLVRLANGRNVSMIKLVNDFNSGVVNHVLSYNKDTGSVIGKVVSAHYSKSVRTLAKVTLSNGKVVECTPDHKFMLLGGEYAEAKDLQQGTLLQTHNDIIVVGSVVLKEVDLTPVYDLTIESDNNEHNFTLGCGIVVSNCHIDMAETAEAGLVILHKELDDLGEPMIVVDLAAWITSPNRINFDLVQNFIYDLVYEAKVNIHTLSMDTFQSEQMLQFFNTKKVAKNVKVQSVDRTIDPYNATSRVIASKAMKVGECPYLQRQLSCIQFDEGKPITRERKDIADCLAGATFSAIKNGDDYPTYKYSNYELIRTNRYRDTLLAKMEQEGYQKF